ncbi:T9SS type A sorting domain-containing protein [Aureispira]|nr:T9SS type A sorting domain-containing protein [Aureispira sp.]
MKRIVILCLTIFGIVIISQSANAQCVSDTNNIYTFVYNGNSYEIIKENLDWTNAAACAVIRGGMLAEINNQDEQDSIFYHVNNAGIIASNTIAPDGGNGSYLWIGGNDLTTEGDWVWNGDNNGTSIQFWQGTTSGSPIGGLYNNWGNEPDNWNEQDGLGFAFTNWPLGAAGEWNDVDDSNTLHYIIEYTNITAIDNTNLQKTALKIYPNPSSNNINIELPVELLAKRHAIIKIYNTLGLSVKEINSMQNNIKVNIDELENGVYFVRLESSNFIGQLTKIIIQK